MGNKSFDITDLERWRTKGLITSEQFDAIKAETGLAVQPFTVEKKPGLNAVTVVYYLAGFLVLLSLVFFIASSWEELTDWARFGIAVGSLLIVGGLAAWLKFRQGYDVAGGLLFMVAAAAFPLVIYTIIRLAGAWPDYASFYDLRFSILVLGLGGLLGAAGALVISRFSLITLIAAGFLHLLLQDIAQFIGGEMYPVSESVAVIAALIILLGIALGRIGWKSHAFWLELYGLIALQSSFTSLFFASDSVLFGLLFLAVYLAFVGISVWLREAVFLVFGAIGFYIYVIRLVFDIFGGSVYASLVVGLSGIAIILLAVFYQKYWTRLFKRQGKA